jgi:hypothetical protein
MRVALLAAALTLPAVATAEPGKFGDLVVWKNTVKPPLPPNVKTLTNVSHVLYLNNCLPNGCTVRPGFDDSLTGHSSIASTTRTLDKWAWGDAAWSSLVNCAKDTFAQFDVTIVTDDPGPNTPHFEVMVGGTAVELDAQLNGAGGVAPFIDCATSTDNVISFVFAGLTDNENFLCGAIAQEASHVWGLDHELDAKDPMTYLDLGSSKRFDDMAANCGEDQPRTCFCGGSTQNSVQFLNNAFGPKQLTPATVKITSPAPNAYVKPGFPVHAELDSQLSFASGSLSVDGSQTQTISSDPLAFNAPANLGGGMHTIQVSATDSGNRTVMDSVTVNVMQACGAGAAACPATFDCLGGFCLPGAGATGGLGADCTKDDECVTGKCTSDGTEMHCAAACDPGNKCPSGFECIADGGAGTCWPGGGGGGCTTGSAPGFLLAALGFAAVLFRRKRL